MIFPWTSVNSIVEDLSSKVDDLDELATLLEQTAADKQQRALQLQASANDDEKDAKRADKISQELMSLIS